jgi:hypothetical protein
MRGWTYLEVRKCRQWNSERLACFHTQGIAFEMHFLDVWVVLQFFDVRVYVIGCVELEAFAFKREDLGVCHNFKPSGGYYVVVLDCFAVVRIAAGV